MIIRGIWEHDLYVALEAVNERYAGNVRFNRKERIGKSRLGAETWAVTLRVHSSKKPGHKIGTHRRRLTAACWHVHGYFLEALPHGTKITTSIGQRGADTVDTFTWADKDVGSTMFPRMASEECECNE